MTESTSETCLNCGAPVRGDFCSECGQRVGPRQVSLGRLLGEVLGEVFDLDGRVARTATRLFARPGQLTREYMAGRRARYTTPFKVYLAATLVWLLSWTLADLSRDVPPDEANVVQISTAQGDAPPTLGLEVGEAGDGVLARRAAERIDAFAELSPVERAEALRSAAGEGIPKAAIVLMPLFALLLRLLYLGGGFTYVEHLVFALHVHAVGFVVASLALWVGGDDVMVLLLVLGLAAYLLLAMRGAYQRPWAGTLARFAFLAPLYSVLLGIGALLGMLGSALS